MLSDRTYMRDNYPRERASVLAWLISAIVAAFVLQLVFERILEMPGALEHFFGLSISGLHAGKVWTLLTYSFLHDTRNLLHIVGNLLGLYFLGRVLLPLLGATRFVCLYATMVLTGAALWTAVNWQVGGSVVGASAGVAGLFIVFACFYPNQPVTFLLFFILPVTLKPKYVAIAAVLIDLAGGIFYEVMGAPSPFGFAHSAHLGGMLAGWVYFRYVHDADWQLPTRRSDIELPKWMKKSAKAAAPAAYQVNVGSAGDLRAEVDRILDKINSQGFGALTADEKRRLDEAKDLLSRR
jgi:membrane associated rhomboid family serine protease